jgi:chitin synthase
LDHAGKLFHIILRVGECPRRPDYNLWKGIELVNTVLKYSYVGILFTYFILSLNNRPQGSNKGYTLAFIGFAIFTVYMTVRHTVSRRCGFGFDLRRMQFAAVFLTIKGVRQVAALRNRGATFEDLFKNAIFRDIDISISATIGLIRHRVNYSCASSCVARARGG